jgi:pimeloyl-ACP methyl ester carboxylesterase
MTDRLTDRFTVVTYDPLGLAHGRLGEPVEEQRVRSWSDGARRILTELLPHGESAYVLGTSSGAIAALDLLTRHPENLRHVIAHEPPVVEVLPDAARQRTMFTEVYETYRAAGLHAAGTRLLAGLADRTPDADQDSAGADHDSKSAAPQPPSLTDELTTPMALFITRVLRQFTAYAPDLDALKPLAPRLTLAAGVDSRGQLLHRTAALTAELSGADFVEFPGGHIGVAEHPAEFAERVAQVLLAA